MSTTETRRIDIDISEDLERRVPEGEPTEATLEIAYGEKGERTVSIDHGQDEWILKFEDGQCVDRDPATRPLPSWIGDAVELVGGEIR